MPRASATPARTTTAAKRGRSASPAKPAAKRSRAASRTPTSRSIKPKKSASGVDRKAAARKAARSRTAADRRVAGKRAARTRQIRGTVTGHTHASPVKGKVVHRTGPRSLAEFKKELNEYTTEELREMLRYNNERSTGLKGELVNRVADRMLHGPLPKCPKCRKGYLHWNPRSKNWRCAGYFEVDHVHPCGHEEDDPVRGEWHQPAEVPAPEAADGKVTLDKPHSD